MGKLRTIDKMWRRLMGEIWAWLCVQVRLPVLTLGDHSADDGVWTVCPDLVHPRSIIYSFGIGRNISWDLAMIDRFGVTINAFDPTQRSLTWLRSQQLPKAFCVHEIGLADYDGSLRLYPPRRTDNRHASYTSVRFPKSDAPVEVPVKRLSTIMADLGHEHVDVLKMDIEGAEYGVIDDLVGMKNPPRQVIVELHGRFPGLRPDDDRRAIRQMKTHGYRVFWISAKKTEYGFIRIDGNEIMRWPLGSSWRWLARRLTNAVRTQLIQPLRTWRRLHRRR